MPFTYCKYSLLLLLLFILLTSHSAYPITARRQQKDAKSILTSPGFLGARPLFHALRDSLLPSSSSFSKDPNRDHILQYKTSNQNANPFVSHRESNGRKNFVIFASSPGRNGITLTNVATPNEDSEADVAESDDVTPAPSKELEPTNDENGRSIASRSELTINSDDNDNTTDKEVPGDNSSAAESDPLPIPEADVFLSVSMDPEGPGNDNSATLAGPQPTREDDTTTLDLSAIDPTADGLLDFDLETASPEDNSDSRVSIETSSDNIPEPSKIPDPQEDAEVMPVPPDRNDVFITPDDDVADDFPDMSFDPAGTGSFEPPETPQATLQLASAPPDVSTDESSDEEETGSVSTTETSQADSSTERKVLVDFPLSFSSSRGTLGPEFDRHSREFLGETTNTTADQWKPTEVSGTVRAIQRQQGSRWEITYQGELAESTAQRNAEALEKNINEGAMDGFLTDRLSTPVSVRTASPPSLNAPPRKEVSLTGAAPKETASGNATTNSEEDDDKSLGVILGTCFGLLGALVLGATVFAVIRRSSRSDEPHVLDGVATAPTTVTSFESDQTETESRFHTGAPTEPRGPTVLRNQSRILDWQMDHATATGKAKHILGRENNANDVAPADSASDEGDVSSAEVLV